MAKNATATAPVRSAKPKTAAQIAKRDRNVKEAAERLAKLQAKQKLLKQLRGMGLTGSDDEIVDQYITQQRIASAKSYISSVLATPNAGQIIKRWLKDRINMSPIHGSMEGHKDNSELKAAVESHLNVERRLSELKEAA